MSFEESMVMRSKEKILLVDDEPELLKSCQALLETVGYEIHIATSGKAAIERLEKDEFDLILLDLNMPEVSGLQVMEQINREKIGVSVIVVSGEISFEWVSKAFYLGAYDFLQKPYEFDALQNTIKNALKKRDLENGFTNLQKQLEHSEKLHRFMVESSPDMIFIVNKEGDFVFVNDRADELLGYRKNELIGKHFSVIVDPEYTEKSEICFRERREGDRAIKNAELWLNCRPGMHLIPEKNKIAIELSSLGIYELEGSEKEERTFSGSYVVARDVTERLAAESLIHFQAYHDLLTGLPNRALFLDRLDNAIRNTRRNDAGLAVMFFDLDRFKVINDSLGHSVGDELLKSLGERLKRALRESDTLSRFGGDEFMVLLPDVDTDEAANKISEKVLSAIKEPFIIDGQEIFITASIGISMYPRDGEDAETLIKNSDVAMYHTKELGKNSYNFYQSDMSVKHHRLLNIENDIRTGITKNQFEVYYQPQIRTEDGSVSGMEALIRWNHPKKGLLFPAFFLSVAEETGLIVDLGDWVLNAGLTEMKNWRESGIEIGRLAVNFSSKQIEQKDFVDKTINALKAFDFPAEALEVEITESTLMCDIENTISKLRQLNDAGVHVAIDDFGTGYSSLSLLQKLPINRLKIDRSFIQDMGQDSDRSIIEAIAHMAKGLKLEMVAEGVEEQYQLDYLKQLECPVLQGFLFSKGLPGDQARQFLRRNLDESAAKALKGKRQQSA